MTKVGAHLLSLACVMVFAACSTVEPQRNERQGLFDIFNKMEAANGGAGGGASKKSWAARVQEEAIEEESREPAAVEAKRDSDSDDQPRIEGLRWPLSNVRVTSGFGKRNGEFHEGVDLHAAYGTKVYAAQAGKVIYAGSKIKGYGKLIVIRHTAGVSTVYAHNSKILVKYGERVIKGQKIAISGKSGRVSGPHLHFEVRRGVAAVDPVQVMPGLKASL